MRLTPGSKWGAVIPRAAAGAVQKLANQGGPHGVGEESLAPARGTGGEDKGGR